MCFIKIFFKILGGGLDVVFGFYFVIFGIEERKLG